MPRTRERTSFYGVPTLGHHTVTLDGRLARVVYEVRDYSQPVVVEYLDGSRTMELRSHLRTPSQALRDVVKSIRVKADSQHKSA